MSQLGRGLWGLGEDQREVCDRVEAGFATWCLFSLSHPIFCCSKLRNLNPCENSNI